MTRLTRLALALVCALAVANASRAATFTVTTAADSGAGSLRQAILDTNANGTSETDTIAFAVAAAGVQTIALASELPVIISPVLIDGYSQPGASPNTLTSAANNAVILICLDGGNRTFQGLRFGFGADGSTVRGLAVQRFRNGIHISAIAADFKGSSLVTGHADPVTDLVTIVGNFIGTDAAGLTDLGNRTGIFVEGVSDNVIGTDTPAGRNVISGNEVGILIEQVATQNTVAGNSIGVAADGMTALGNSIGIYIQGSHENHVQANVISGNTGTAESAGIVVEGASIGNWIDANFIGTARGGTGTIPNACGMRIAGDERGSPSDTTIGILENVLNAQARVNAAGNVIANNLLDGVSIPDPQSTTTRINYNTFRNNGGLAIDLGDDGPTPNDAGDTDTGANLLQNFPVITSAVQNEANEGLVHGTLDSLPLTDYIVRLHHTDTCDPSGFGEGAYEEETTVTTDAAGHATFTFDLPFLPAGFVTATATDPNGNTSEFSACAPIVSDDEPLTATLSILKQGPPAVQPGANITWTLTVTNEGTTPSTGVTVSDPLPPATTFVSATPTQGSCTGTTTITCTLGLLPAGATATITLTATAPQTPQPIVNTATLSSNQTETTPADNASTNMVVVAGAALAGVPLLDGYGIAAMAALLGALALMRLR